MVTIYVDVLIILNIYVNYFLLKTTAKITRTPIKIPRCIAASAYGSLFSLTILLPELPFAFSLLIKLVAAVTVVLAAFGFHSKERFFINSVSFFTVNFLTAGAVYAVYSWLRPEFMHFNNSFFYIDFSLIILVLSTAVLYFAVCTIRTITDRIPDDCGCYRIIVRNGDRVFSLNGLADTGNSLVDFFTGRPVIICGRDSFHQITGAEFDFSQPHIPKGFRLIPCSTISSSGVIPAFLPDEIIIVNDKSGTRKSVEAMVGFGTESTAAIFNPKLLKN